MGGVVRDLTLRQWAIAVLLLMMPWVAEAAGLGRLTVISSLGQPLSAEIDLVSVEKDELATLSARLASPDAYKQANLQYGPALIGLRLSIEKRPNGQLYIKIISTRPVNEPFIDLLVEINWASGRITREYTGLIDPPGYASAPVPPAPVALPETRPAPAPTAPAVAIAPAARPAVTAPVATAGKEYGPIKRGETLFKIASSTKPEGVTLEQMLAGLYRNNPDAFSQNMNRMKTGKILRVPDKEELAAVPQQEAAKEVRVQAADWNAYRKKLADAAGTAPESRASARGKITTKVDDGASAGEVKDVVRLSKGEPPKGAVGAGAKSSAADRVRTLEEEAIARDKALSEANDRIAHLEKNLKDMQQLLALKSPAMAAAQQKAGAPAPEAAKPEAKPAPEAPKPAPKPEVAADKPAATPPEAPKLAEAAKPEEVKAPAPAPAAEMKPETPKPAPKPKPKPVPPPPPPEPDVMDIVMDNLPLVGGGAALLLGGLGLWMVRRRRSQAGAEPEDEAQAPTLGKAGTNAVSEATATIATTAGAEPTAAAPAADEVDPLAEAEIYIAYGRDTQAEEILKEALAKRPGREDVQFKLLEIYAARKDKTLFNRGAEGFSKLTGGEGENWLKVAAMGYVLDPGNAMYAAGQSAAPAEEVAVPEPVSDLDFDLGQSTGATSTDISIDPLIAGKSEMEQTSMMEPGGMRSMAGGAEEKPDDASMAPLMPDFTLEIPEAGPSLTQTDIFLDSSAPDGTSSNIDFNIELPRDDDGSSEPTMVSLGEKKDADSGMDFKLDIGDINLNLDDKPAAGATEEGGDKDAHWYDVQTKFDLAKAYQEMGDKDGAKEILQEVIKEGDAEQQAEANKLLATLG